MTTAEPMSASELAEYDAETRRQTIAAEQRIAESEARAAELAGAARDAKKTAKEEAKELRRVIREREDERGKRPAPTILDLIPKAPAWHALPVAALDIPAGIRQMLAIVPTMTAGELHAEVTGFDPAQGAPFGLAIGDVATVRMHLAELADREAAVPQPAIPEDLWRSFPVARWTRWGITAKDAEKLEAGEVKRDSQRRPIRTVGDLSNFTAPTAGGYSRNYADIKGIGAAGGERISAAESRFWAWWKDGGEEEFARERGLIRGDATIARPGSGAHATAARAADPDDIAPDLARLADDGGPADDAAEAAFDREADAKRQQHATDGNPYHRGGYGSGW